MKVRRSESEYRFLAHCTNTLAADHVYEAQTLANFIKWLADETGNIGTTYKKPTADWVSKQILGEGPFRITSLGTTGVGSLNTPTAGEIPVSLMAYGFGRSDGVKSVSGGQTVERIPKARGNKNLVLLDKNINGPKGIWFRKNKLDSDWKGHVSQEKARLEVRRVSSKSVPCFSSTWFLTELQHRAWELSSTWQPARVNWTPCGRNGRVSPTGSTSFATHSTSNTNGEAIPVSLKTSLGKQAQCRYGPSTHSSSTRSCAKSRKRRQTGPRRRKPGSRPSGRHRQTAPYQG